MTKQSAIKQLETIIGKLSKINFHIEDSSLGDAINEVAYTRNKLREGKIEVRKFTKKKVGDYIHTTTTKFPRQIDC
jgi:hypothetical protein